MTPHASVYPACTAVGLTVRPDRRRCPAITVASERTKCCSMNGSACSPSCQRQRRVRVQRTPTTDLLGACNRRCIPHSIPSWISASRIGCARAGFHPSSLSVRSRGDWCVLATVVRPRRNGLELRRERRGRRRIFGREMKVGAPLVRPKAARMVLINAAAYPCDVNSTAAASSMRSRVMRARPCRFTSHWTPMCSIPTELDFPARLNIKIQASMIVSASETRRRRCFNSPYAVNHQPRGGCPVACRVDGTI